VTKETRKSALSDSRFCVKNCSPGKSGERPQGKIRAAEKLPATAGGILLKSLPRKSSKMKSDGTVPQTDTGGQVE
jgi:hypothetical protein